MVSAFFVRFLFNYARNWLYASVGGAAINHGVRLKRVADPGAHFSDSGHRLKCVDPCPHNFLTHFEKYFPSLW